MQNVFTNMFTGFFYDNDSENNRPTWPPPGTADLIIEDKCSALFFSAIWELVATIDNEEIARSTESNIAHSRSFTRQWTRQVIRLHYVTLRRAGVDAEAEYIKWGGKLEDLKT